MKGTGISHTLITGGAGFIGSNLAGRLIAEGHAVTIYDNLSRPGCVSNLQWLRNVHGPRSFQLVEGSVTDYNRLREATEGAGRVYHLAGQVAVTTSVRHPRKDFEDNAVGTINVLEATREVASDAILLYSSTNKVYGQLNGIEVVEENTRYRFRDMPFGVPEIQPLDFHSPYGCSKGAGDQYVHDYARIYGLKTVTMRQSCIYGQRQFGQEDQGWVAWFMIAALKGWPIKIYGDGKQVRDLLFVDDLLDAFEAAMERISVAAGQIYNLGGGPQNTASIWAEFGPILESLTGSTLSAEFSDWRPGDQLVYVSDVRKAWRDLGWAPKHSVAAGTRRLFEWLNQNLDEVESRYDLITTMRASQ